MPISKVVQVDSPSRDSDSPELSGESHFNAEELNASIKLKNSMLPTLTFSKPEELPSKAIPYPSKWSVTIRAYVFGEIEKFDSGLLTQKEQYNIVLAGIESSFPKEDLTLQDFYHLALDRRLLTMHDNDIWFGSFCPACGSENRVKYKTTNFEYDSLKIDELPVGVTLDGQDLKFTPMTVGRRLSIDEPTIDNNTWMANCSNLADSSNSVEDLKEFLGGLSHPDDIYLLRYVDRLMYHGPKPFQVSCIGVDEDQEKCGYPYLVNPASLVDVFILPFRTEESERCLENKIRFGA